MTTLPLLVRSIKQKDNFTFTLEWSDRITNEYRLCDLQRICPCAKCFEMRQTNSHQVDDNVRALRIFSTGRYAMRIQFTSGCSAGIYHYTLLRRLSQHQHD